MNPVCCNWSPNPHFLPERQGIGLPFPSDHPLTSLASTQYINRHIRSTRISTRRAGPGTWCLTETVGSIPKTSKEACRRISSCVEHCAVIGWSLLGRGITSLLDVLQRQHHVFVKDLGIEVRIGWIGLDQEFPAFFLCVFVPRLPPPQYRFWRV